MASFPSTKFIGVLNLKRERYINFLEDCVISFEPPNKTLKPVKPAKFANSFQTRCYSISDIIIMSYY